MLCGTKASPDLQRDNIITIINNITIMIINITKHQVNNCELKLTTMNSHKQAYIK